MKAQLITFSLSGMTDEEFRDACEHQWAQAVAGMTGLVSKTWLANTEQNRYGGVYVWERHADIEQYVRSDFFRALASDPRITEVESRVFDVMPARHASPTVSVSSPRRGGRGDEMATLRDRLKLTPAPIFGRDGLLDELHEWALHDDLPVVTYLHGLAGIGKSTVATALAERARAAGTLVLEIDCGTVQPTESGVLDAFGRLADRPVSRVGDIAGAVARDGRLLVVLDDYDAWRLIDSWVRRQLLPALPSSSRILICGRDRPNGAWRFVPEWRDACRPLELGPVDDAAAMAFLVAQGLSPADAGRVQSLVRGHPLALSLALSAIGDNARHTVDAAVAEGVLAGLVHLYMESVPDRPTRAALEAASVTRRSTESLLSAQLSPRRHRPLMRASNGCRS